MSSSCPWLPRSVRDRKGAKSTNISLSRGAAFSRACSSLSEMLRGRGEGGLERRDRGLADIRNETWRCSRNAPGLRAVGPRLGRLYLRGKGGDADRAGPSLTGGGVVSLFLLTDARTGERHTPCESAHFLILYAPLREPVMRLPIYPEPFIL